MKNIIYSIISLLACLVWPFACAAADLVGIDAEKGQETITLSVPKLTPRHVFTVADPDRLVVDVPGVSGHKGVSLPSSYDGRLIKGMRFGQFDSATSRFVFDLAQPVQISDTHPEKGKLVITIEPAAGKPEARESAPEMSNLSPAQTERAGAGDWQKKKTFSSKLSTGKSYVSSHSRKSSKPLVVIDPGHGGVDPGTIGPDGSYEKDLTLAYAKALKARLLKTNHYRVKLTRDDDRFIMLRSRVAIARKEGADIFISLHADSAPEMSARGLSIYTVSEKASDREAEALASRENKSDVLAGMDLSDEKNDVAGILISLAQRETKNQSATLADTLVDQLDDKVRLLSNSHRFAGFAVLKAPDVPSVLIEIGFLSHPAEEKLLKSKSYRERVVSGIAAGVDAYFAQQKREEP